MYEKVNPSHPDKIADRIGGAIVDLAYSKEDNPKVAVEVLIGHGACHVIVETDTELEEAEIEKAIGRIAGSRIRSDIVIVPQDRHLAMNQKGKLRCGDNGIFRGVPATREQEELSDIARTLYEYYPYDGKYILDGKRFIICQSKASREDLRGLYPEAEINPLGDWTGGLDVDTGAINRKLGSDMGDGVTGGGLHGKDLSKADVAVSIYAFLMAKLLCRKVEISCAIGDEIVDGRPYEEIVEIARSYIKAQGGFEKFAEWGLL